MASTTGVMRHLGMEHPPFPQVGPTFPPPSQPRGTVHDVSGPQGIHYGDIDEYDDGIEDEEGEYESNNEQVEVFGLLLFILTLISVYFVGCIRYTLCMLWVCICIYGFFSIIYLS